MMPRTPLKENVELDENQLRRLIDDQDHIVLRLNMPNPQVRKSTLSKLRAAYVRLIDRKRAELEGGK